MLENKTYEIKGTYIAEQRENDIIIIDKATNEPVTILPKSMTEIELEGWARGYYTGFNKGLCQGRREGADYATEEIIKLLEAPNFKINI